MPEQNSSEATVVQDLGLQLVNLTIQKAYSDAETKRLVAENEDLRRQLAEQAAEADKAVEAEKAEPAKKAR